MRKLNFLILILTLTLVCTPATAYIRDADLSASEDCIGVGYVNGIMFFGEKVLEDKRSSFGSFFTPSINYGGSSSYISSFWEMSYNRQLSSPEASSALSAVLGICGYQEKTPDADEEKADYKILPEVGFIMSFKTAEKLSTRVRLVLGPLFGIEFGYRFLENTEVSIGLGIPIFSIKIVFHPEKK